jgi:hypothetical protein
MTAARPRLTDLLTNMVVTFLTPMFLMATDDDVDQARAGAFDTVRACAARHPMDLLMIGQMIALGLATLSSVSLSMAEDIPISFVLRLRGNAVSLHRASETCRRALPEPGHAPAYEQPDLDPEAQPAVTPAAGGTGTHPAPLQLEIQPVSAPLNDPDFFPESLEAMKAAMAHIVAESERRGEAAQSSTAATRQTAAPIGAQTASGRTLSTALSYALPDAAPQVIDGLATPPAERHVAGMRATALSSTANRLLTPPPR